MFHVSGTQRVEGGYQFFAGRKLVTVFSAPDYKGYGFPGSVISVNKQAECTFQLISVERTALNNNVRLQCARDFHDVYTAGCIPIPTNWTMDMDLRTHNFFNFLQQVNTARYIPKATKETNYILLENLAVTTADSRIFHIMNIILSGESCRHMN